MGREENGQISVYLAVLPGVIDSNEYEQKTAD